MVSVPLGKSDWRRAVADEADIQVKNRYFETNPTNQIEQSALLSRPGLRRWLEVGEGPIRALYSQPGAFSDALFVMSYDSLYRVDSDETVTLISDGFMGTGIETSPSMAATAEVGDMPAHLFIADGRWLWLYVENGYAVGSLSGTVADNDVIVVGGVYYKWTSGDVDTGTPDGTSGAPWLVAMGDDNIDAMENMMAAINADGIEGETYSTGLVDPHPTATAISYTANSIRLRAVSAGTIGNGVTTTTTGSSLAWDAGTLEDGGEPMLEQVQVPDDVGVISVGYIGGYIIVVIAQGYGVNGRFYWIEPGETVIDPLNFATAERAPDPVLSVRVVGDQFWLLGSNSNEIWYLSGDPEAPFQRVQARVFDRGIWEGSDVQIKDTVVVVDNDGVVYAIAGGGPERISTNSIEERIRKSMRIQEIVV